MRAMREEVASLARREPWDLVIIGGGIYGAACLWEAALRGLEAVLVERGDFASGASANSLKVVHGGFRYLQGLDLPRLRRAARERSILLGIAPYLVEPLPCVVPAGGGLKGRPALLRLAAGIYNTLAGPWERIPQGQGGSLRARGVDQEELADLAGELLCGAREGGVLWYDALAWHTERLVMAFILSALEAGAKALNHAPVERLLLSGGRVRGVLLRDALEGGELEVPARAVVVSAGPWESRLLGETRPQPDLALALNLVVTRRLCRAAVGLRSQTPPAEDPVCGGFRYLFAVPWQGCTMLGTAYHLHRGEVPEAPEVPPELLRRLLEEFNQACPGLELRTDEVCFYHAGLVPLAKPGRAPDGGGLASRRRLVDWGREGGPSGVVSVMGAKYTTGRAAAEEVLDLVCGQLGKGGKGPASRERPLWGAEARPPAEELPPQQRHLPRLYGSRVAEVLAAGPHHPVRPGAPLLACEVLHAVQSQGARRLGDVVFRRSALAAGRRPGREELMATARLMAWPLGWDRKRLDDEVATVETHYRPVDRLQEEG